MIVAPGRATRRAIAIASALILLVSVVQLTLIAAPDAARSQDEPAPELADNAEPVEAEASDPVDFDVLDVDARALVVPGAAEGGRLGTPEVIGDVNGDGIDDLAVGAFSDSTAGEGVGAVHIVFMAEDGTAADTTRITRDEAGFGGSLLDNGGFGFRIAAVGDLDGDGVPDIVVSAYRSDRVHPDAGEIWTLFLNADGTVKDWQVITEGFGGLDANLREGDQFGVDVTAIGDLDGDDITELAVGMWRRDGLTEDEGGVLAVFLNADGTAKDYQEISAVAGWPDAPLGSDTGFGVSVEGLGDLDGDGTPELGVGAIAADEGRGEVWILSLDENARVVDSARVAPGMGPIAGIHAGARFGSGLAAVGDIDGDDAPEIAVGGFGLKDSRGVVWLIELDDDFAPVDVRRVKAPQLVAGDLFGHTLAVAASDDAVELIVGAPGSDVDGADRGAVYVLEIGASEVADDSEDAPTEEPVAEEPADEPAADEQPAEEPVEDDTSDEVADDTTEETTDDSTSDEDEDEPAPTPEPVDPDAGPDGDPDGDGIPNAVEGTGDIDADGIPNNEDPDTDGDGIPDAVEGLADADGDGIADFVEIDDDGDGILTIVEGTGDSDGDGTPDHRDADSDNDGLSDGEEGTGDADQDGLADNVDPDSDNDGLSDGEEGTGDADQDGLADNVDPDSDNDGLSDGEEGTGDSDNDGLPDNLDDDSDNDGLLDGEEGSGDSDLDGLPDNLDDDSDNDGVADADEGTGDSDNDGLPDAVDDDSDNDGLSDGQESTDDSDGDGLPDNVDDDSDNDGLIDGDEGTADIDGDGLPNAIDDDADGDGFSDAEEGAGDSDEDGVPNFLDAREAVFSVAVLTAPEIRAGETTELQLEVVNHGPDPSSATSAQLELPEGIIVDPASTPDDCQLAGRTLTCEIGELAVDESAVRTIDAEVLGAVRTLEMEATVDAREGSGTVSTGPLAVLQQAVPDGLRSTRGAVAVVLLTVLVCAGILLSLTREQQVHIPKH